MGQVAGAADRHPRAGARWRTWAPAAGVDDDGPGIAPDKIAGVLQRGVRGDERVQGHGIGLSIVQDIIQGYGGELRVERSQELGGARFEARLPLPR